MTANDKEDVVIELGERKAKIKNNAEVMIGDVIATLDDDSAPIVAPVAGKAEVSKKTITIVPSNQNVVRYEIPGFKQIIVSDGNKVEAGQV